MLRIGIVGCGKIADGHVEQIRATGRGDVVAVCDREPLMVEQLAERMRIPGRHTDLATMLANERLDVVHVAAHQSQLGGDAGQQQADEEKGKGVHRGSGGEDGKGRRVLKQALHRVVCRLPGVLSARTG